MHGAALYHDWLCNLSLAFKLAKAGYVIKKPTQYKGHNANKHQKQPRGSTDATGKIKYEPISSKQ
ncbi:hypothetical protein A6J60_003755 [Psychrobacter sp. FDAARGOS_221]|nr:hypothetical protein A6J60_003755 [Psychrobacter sp. FDAARGOS_221]